MLKQKRKLVTVDTLPIQPLEVCCMECLGYGYLLEEQPDGGIENKICVACEGTGIRHD